MPINIPDGLPAAEKLAQENVFYLQECHASHQDIRPLKIAILNLMPKKIETETQLLRLLSNTPLQLEDVYKRQNQVRSYTFKTEQRGMRRKRKQERPQI